MRLIVFLSTLLALALVGYFGIAGYFLAYSVAELVKVGPLSSSQQAADRPDDPLALGYRGDPMQALSLPFQTVPLETPLGQAGAWLVPAEGAEVGRAVYVHGIAGAREDGYRHLSMLHEAGWSVLLISYRNDPDAPEAPEGSYGFGLLEWPDLEAAVAHMAPDAEGAGVLVVAESMGGAILGQLLAQSKLSGRVKAVALDSPALSFSAVIGHLAVQSGQPLPGAMAWTAKLILPALTGLPLDQAEVAEVYRSYPGPVFIAHGEGDRIVPISPSQALAEARAEDTVTLWTTADYLGSYAADPQAYRSAFATFLAGLVD